MDLTRAKELLSELADGINPLTGELLPDDSVCNQAEIVRAFHTVLAAIPAPKEKYIPPNAGKPWTSEDDEKLSQMYDAGSTKKDMCSYFQRTEGAIAARLVHIGKVQSREEYRIKVR
ncbi:MAG: hypothetical protein GXY01_06380 [Clostridiales bacterium]|jgi:hypothetical protein|nr:hypothetical protein [Clostridiales bacterium]